MLEKRLVRRSSATPPRRFPALPLSRRSPRARYGHSSDSPLRPQGGRGAMSRQSLDASPDPRGGRQSLRVAPREPYDWHAANEVAHRKRRGEARRAVCGKNVVGAGDIVSEHLGAVVSDEDRSGAPEEARVRGAVPRLDPEVLGSKPFEEVHRRTRRGSDADRAVARQRLSGPVSCRDLREPPPERLLDP